MTLITDQSFATGVYRRRPARIAGTVDARRRRARRPAARAASTPTRKVREDDVVYTVGHARRRPPAVALPAGDPDRQRQRIDLGDGDLDRRIHVKPAADMRRLDIGPGR